jgi:hypothetical protein
MGIALGVFADEIDAIDESPLDGSRSLAPKQHSAITALTKLSSFMVGFRHITVMYLLRRRSAIGVEFASHTPPLRASGIGAFPSLPRVPAKVRSPNPQRSHALSSGNRAVSSTNLHPLQAT